MVARKTLYLFFIMISQFLIGQGSKSTLRGKITDLATGRALVYTSVYIEEIKSGTVSDGNGDYRIQLRPGTYTVVASYTGYGTVRKKVILKGDQMLDIGLAENLENLEEVIVTGESEDQNVRGVDIGLQTLNTAEIKALPTFLGQTDVVKSLLLLPGVSTVGEGASGFNVRGGKVGQNLVLYNGAPLFNSSHILGLFSSFNTDAVESFDLYKGHIPARYGGRLSSVLNVKGREGSMDKYGLDASIGVLTGKILIEGPISQGKTSFLVSGRATYSDWVLGLAENPDVKESSVAFYDINANVTHNFNSNNKLSLGYYGSNDKFQFAEDFGFRWHTDLMSARWSTLFGSKLGTTFNIAYSGYKSTSFDPGSFDSFSLETGIDYLSARGELIYTPNEKAKFRVGAERVAYRGKPERLERTNEGQSLSVETVDKERASEISGYVEGEISLLPWLSSSLGARYTLFRNIGPYEVFDYLEGLPITERNISGSTSFGKGDPIQQYSGLEPRASLRAQLGKQNSVKFGYGRTRQYIHSITNSASPTPADLWQMSNRYFKPQISDNFSLGYFHNFNDNMFETSVEGFYRNIANQVEYRDFAELFNNNHLETELAAGKGRAYGVELFLNKTKGDWTGWISYAYTRSFVTMDNDVLEERINNGKEFPSNADQPHKVNIVLKNKIKKKSSFSTSFTYITGRPITAVTSSFELGGTTIPIFTKRNGERIPEFIRLDVSLTVAENIWTDHVKVQKKKYEDSISFSLYNVLNRRNAFSVFYQRADNRNVLVAKKLSVIGSIVPSITYNISF